MAISDAYVLAMCDGGNCREHVEIQLPRRHRNMADSSGYPDDHEHTLGRLLKEQEWVCRDGKHFCSRECAEFANGEGRHG